jgi:hypothetical protein
MELFLPSFVLIAVAIVIVVGALPRFTPFLLSLLALLLLGFAAFHHYTLFKDEYKVQTWMEIGKSVAPILMIGLVVILSVGYLLYLFGLKGVPQMKMPFARAPPPNTATNTVTEAIGNAVENWNNGSNNNAAENNIISKNPSLNIGSKEAANIAASRLARQI